MAELDPTKGFPLHEGCGGPLVVASLLPATVEPAPASSLYLVCAKCRAKVEGSPEVISQSAVALRAVLALVPSFFSWALGEALDAAPAPRKRAPRAAKRQLEIFPRSKGSR